MPFDVLENSYVLNGDNTIPGERMPGDIEANIQSLFDLAKKFGLDYYPTVVEFLDLDAMAEVCSYGGFPLRYPHWRWGMNWEEYRKDFGLGRSRVYEIVINCSPCILYCLNSNNYVDNVTVILHALAHCDFFKNNVFFDATSKNAVNDLANHGTRIRRYQSRRGRDIVSSFINKLLMIETLVDNASAWKKRQYEEPATVDAKEYQFPRKLKVEHDYMEEWLNTPEWMRKEEDRIRKEEIQKDLDIFTEPTKDIFGYLREHAPLKLWQQDIMSMIYDECLYFSPQRGTKIINEGWASFTDFHTMASMGMAGNDGIISYAEHKAGVLGPKYAFGNPYRMGMMLLMDIEDRWDKGRFGKEYEECKDMLTKQEWDKKLGLGRQKVFDVRKYYNDFLLVHEFMTPEFIEKYEFFEWELLPNGDYVIKSRDPAAIKQKVLRNLVNGGLPEIFLEEPNYKNKGIFLMQHKWDGRMIYSKWAQEVLPAIWSLWQAPVLLATRDKDGREMVYVCTNDNYKDVKFLPREEVEKAL